MFKLGFGDFIKEAVGMRQYAGTNGMPFPGEYFAALKSGEKNTTYRVDNEMGKYKVGKIYRATSYGGRNLSADIEIISVDRVSVSDIPTSHACEISTYHPKAESADKIKFKVL